ncbi:MAG TPA: hypothetical protein VF157_05730, partial [Chloroflexota bacterium]
MDLLFDMPVLGADGRVAGQLDRLLVSATEAEVTHVAVRSDLASVELLVPLSLVENTLRGGLRLRIPSAQLLAMPRYYAGRTDVPPTGRIDVLQADARAALAGREFVDSLAPGELEHLSRQEQPNAPAARHEAEQHLALSNAMRVRVDTAELGPEAEVQLAGGLRGRLKGLGTEQDRNLVAQLRFFLPDYGELLAPSSRLGDLRERPIMVSATPADLEQHAVTPVANYVELEGSDARAARGE